MDTQQNTALTRALAEVPRPLPASGVIHITIPHTDRFTVVGNHLAQHPDLSCTAIGIAVRIQSLPPRNQGRHQSTRRPPQRRRKAHRRRPARTRNPRLPQTRPRPPAHRPDHHPHPLLQPTHRAPGPSPPCSKGSPQPATPAPVPEHAPVPANPAHTMRTASTGPHTHRPPPDRSRARITGGAGTPRPRRRRRRAGSRRPRCPRGRSAAAAPVSSRRPARGPGRGLR